MLDAIRRRWWLMTSMMGPGFLAAMADNDAGGIAMYMQAGAEYGYAVLGVVMISMICLAICQDLSARMGIASGQGLASLVRRQYGVRIGMVFLMLLFIANLATTIAEFVGIAVAGTLLGIADWIAVLIAGVMLCMMALFCCYRKIEKILLLLCLSFGAYLAGGYVAIPTVDAVWNGICEIDYREIPFWLMTIGVIGTTVTPWGQIYLQSSVVDKGLDRKSYRYLRIDVLVGSLLTGIIALGIVCLGAMVFGIQGIPYTSLLQSGEALTVIFGAWANLLFGMGLVGASLLAAFIVPLSTAYAVCEVIGAEYGLDRSLAEAPVFFGTYLFVLIGGMLGALFGGTEPLWTVIVAQIANGILLLPIWFCMVMLAQEQCVMGSYVNGVWQNRLAIFVLIVLTIAEGGLVLSV